MAVLWGPFTFISVAGPDALSWTFNSTTGAGLDNGNGFWEHDTDDSPSVDVGPTSGQGGDPEGYVYTEASTPGGFNDVFTMEFGETLDASNGPLEITFYTNQRGDDNDVVCQVQINEDGGGWVDVGSAFGGPSDPDKVASGGTQIWTLRTVDLSASGVNVDASTLVRIECTLPSSGNAFHNDYGIDTITISDAAPTQAAAYKSFIITASGDTGEQDITGLGFKPTAVHITWTNTDVVNTSQVNLDHGVFLMSGGNCVTFGTGMTSTTAVRSQVKDILGIREGSTGVEAVAVVYSLPDGLRFDWTTAKAGTRLHVIAMGGDIDHQMGTPLANSSPEDNMSFEPEFILTAGIADAGFPSTSVASVWGIGALDDTREWSAAPTYATASTSIFTDSSFFLVNNAGTVSWEIGLGSIDTDGFTWTGTDSDAFGYLAVSFKGAIGVRVGSFLKETTGVDTVTQQIGAQGFRPHLILFANCNTDEDAGPGSDDGNLSVGIDDAANGAASFLTTGDSGNHDKIARDDASILMGVIDVVIDAKAKVTTWAANPTITWEVASTDTARIGYVSFETVPPDPSGAVIAPAPTATGRVGRVVTGAVTAPNATATGTADSHVTVAASAVTSPAATATGTARIHHFASGTVTSPAATATGTARIHHFASGTVTSPAATATGTARIHHFASGTVTSPAATATGACTLGHPLSGTVTSPAATATGACTLGHPLSGAVTSPAAICAGTVTLAHPVSGAVTAPTATSAGTARIHHFAVGAVDAPACEAAGITDFPPRVFGTVTSPAATATGTVRICHPLSGTVVCTVPFVQSFVAVPPLEASKLHLGLILTPGQRCVIVVG